eukprot:scaffold2171_cov253-Pinguiococcus_pyrenoidosus.AAC.10
MEQLASDAVQLARKLPLHHELPARFSNRRAVPARRPLDQRWSQVEKELGIGGAVPPTGKTQLLSNVLHEATPGPLLREGSQFFPVSLRYAHRTRRSLPLLVLSDQHLGQLLAKLQVSCYQADNFQGRVISCVLTLDRHRQLLLEAPGRPRIWLQEHTQGLPSTLRGLVRHHGGYAATCLILRRLEAKEVEQSPVQRARRLPKSAGSDIANVGKGRECQMANKYRQR